MYFPYNKRIYLPQLIFPIVFFFSCCSHNYLCALPPLKHSFSCPFFCFLVIFFSYIYCLFNSPSFRCKKFANFSRWTPKGKGKIKRPCNLNSSLKKTLKRKFKKVHTNTKSEIKSEYGCHLFCTEAIKS